MKPKDQQIAIAKACGWKFAPYDMRDPQGKPVTYISGLGRDRESYNVEDAYEAIALKLIPDYLNDLNAMHEAEKVLIARGGLPTYEHFLQYNEIKKGSEPWYGSIHATAAQRAEAFLKTLNLWVE